MPDPTSSLVADACRRANLPYEAPAIAGYADTMNVAGVAYAAASSAGEDLARCIRDLQGLLERMGRLYGPALPAPAVEVLARLTGAWDGFRWEVEDGHRRRLQLDHQLAGARSQVLDLIEERDRARDVAVALEQAAAGCASCTARAEVDEALDAPLPALPVLRCRRCQTTWSTGPDVPRVCPECSAADLDDVPTSCTCGDPERVGVLHRIDGLACYVGDPAPFPREVAAEIRPPAQPISAPRPDHRPYA